MERRGEERGDRTEDEPRHEPIAPKLLIHTRLHNRTIAPQIREELPRIARPVQIQHILVCPIIPQQRRVVEPVIALLLRESAGVMVAVDGGDEGDVHDVRVEVQSWDFGEDVVRGGGWVGEYDGSVVGRVVARHMYHPVRPKPENQ